MKNHILMASPLFLFAVSMGTGCDDVDEAPLRLEDLVEAPESATTGFVEPVVLDAALEDGLELDEPDVVPSDDTPMEHDFDLHADVDAQELNPLGYWSWGTPGNGGARLYLGSASDRTCFLQGVTGTLHSRWKYTPAGVYVRIDPSNNQWYIETDAGVAQTWPSAAGSGVMGYATCVPNVSNRKFRTWENKSGQWNNFYSYAPRGFGTRCFLSSVWGNSGWASGDSYVRIHKAQRNGEPTWELGGDLVDEQDGRSSGGAEMVCVDTGLQSTAGYSFEVPMGGPASALISTTTTQDQACAVHTLSGNFTSSGWDKGVRIFPASGPAGDIWAAIGLAGGSASDYSIGGECYRNIVWSWPSWP